MPYSDQQLRDAIDAVFHQFDTDNSGTLNGSDVVGSVINASLKHMNVGRSLSQQEVDALIAAGDQNGDGKIDKAELFEIFKQVVQN